MSSQLDLPVGGMTCASCAARIEKRLNRLDGVHAQVNYATERAAVEFDPETVTPDDLVAAIESIGYQAHLPSPDGAAANDRPQLDHELARLVICATRRCR